MLAFLIIITFNSQASLIQLKVFSDALGLHSLQLYIKSKNFKTAIRQCENYLNERPADTEFLFLTSYAYKQAREFTNALDYGERVHLREPGHVKNLINLAEIYTLSGNKKRADYLLSVVEGIEPENFFKKQLVESILYNEFN